MDKFPSPEQQSVITHQGKPLVVVAGPGTGKTRTLAERVIRILKEDADSTVVLITFTRTSRRDTRKKIDASVTDFQSVNPELEIPRIATVHKFAKALLHHFAADIGLPNNFRVLIGSAKEDLILVEEALEDIEITSSVADVKTDLIAFRSTDDGKRLKHLTTTQFAKFIGQFATLCKFYGAIDMEGIVPLVREILSKKPEVVPQMYLHVDEYQDLNPLDQGLIKVLVDSARHEIVVVGDDAQSIYGRRHAAPEGIRNLVKDAAWENISFSKSHRLPPHILRASQKLIQGYGYVGGSISLPKDDGQLIRTFSCSKSEYEDIVVGGLIKEIMTRGESRDGNQLEYKDFMILCPSSKQLRTTAACLEQHFQIPIKTRSVSTIPPDYWKLILLLRMVIGDDDLALRQWLPVLDILGEDIATLRHEAMEQSRSLFNQIRLSTDNVLTDFLTKLNQLRSCKDNAPVFIDCLKNFSNLVVSDDLFPDVGLTIDAFESSGSSLSDILEGLYERFGLIDPEDDISEEDKVLLATMHSSKGLEAEIVFITRLNRRLLPQPGINREEQLRVLYVAMTRAKQAVFFLYSDVYDLGRGRKVDGMSPFLEIVKSHLSIERIKKQDLKRYN